MPALDWISTFAAGAAILVAVSVLVPFAVAALGVLFLP